MKITEKTAPSIRVFQLELSEAELREIERCLCATDGPSGKFTINYDTWDAVDTFIAENLNG